MGKLFTITEGLENMGAVKTGGQGSVYKTRRTGSIITAVKLLPTPIYSESADDKNFSDFQAEVQKLRRVSEKPCINVVKILASGITETGNLPFIEMEYIEGPDLEDLLKPPHDPVFTIKETIKVAEQISNALAHCHRLGIRHGDVKSNNIKWNIHTSNYVLLDFGLALMSDEQRRTSLRQAGAVEFMAPEQTEGKLLFETDVYSFGIILYELLAGSVPFPLRSGTELARNQVLLAHLEQPLPNLLSKRKAALPATWPAQKQLSEAAVPHWLLQLVEQCLAKKPEQRFENGVALQEYIATHATNATASPIQSKSLAVEEPSLKSLRRERDQLQKRNTQLEKNTGTAAQEIAVLKNTLGNREAELATLRKALDQQPGTGFRRKRSFAVILFWMFLAAVAGFIFRSTFNDRMPVQQQQPVASQQTQQPTNASPQPEVIQNRNIGQFKVQREKAYFHNEPDPATRRNAYLLPNTGTVINGWDERNGFIYTEYTNSRGQLSKGWLQRSDLQTLDEWEREHANDTAYVNTQMQQARDLINQNDAESGVAIYQSLIKANIPQAMYELSNLALHDKCELLACDDAMRLLQRASDLGYAPAKRTLGFLYVFGENQNVLQVSNYDRCPHEKNVARGTKLLMEAVLAGDTSANKWLQLHQESDEQ